MNSHKSGKFSLPHIHIDYHHEKEASVAIADGQLLAGKLPSKVLKKVQKQIANNKKFLFECWNSMTDGLKVDINYSFGKRVIQENKSIYFPGILKRIVIRLSRDIKRA